MRNAPTLSADHLTNTVDQVEAILALESNRWFALNQFDLYRRRHRGSIE